MERGNHRYVVHKDVEGVGDERWWWKIIIIYKNIWLPLCRDKLEILHKKAFQTTKERYPFKDSKTCLSCMCKKTKMSLAVLCTTKLVLRWPLYYNNKKKLEYNQSGNMSQVVWRSQTFIMNFSTRKNRLECGWCNQKWMIRGIIFVANVWAKQKISLRNLVQVCLQNKKPDLSQ